MFKDYQQKKKVLILSALSTFLSQQKQKGSSQNPWKTDVLERLSLFLHDGKMIRGTLVCLGYDIQTDETSDDVIKLALAMELFHAGLLIHDDIMDNTNLRRGQPSLHLSYTNLLTQQQSRYPKNTGKSLAICVGDYAFFLGMQVLSECKDKEMSIQIMSLFTKELQIVTTAQMQDISFGASNKPVHSIDDILSLYQEKTGRYSVLLPLTAGAILGKANGQTIKHIAKFSESIGIAYQLTDDMLDLFGNEKDTGKPTGTDIREGKQTPFIYFLRELEDKEINAHLIELFSKGEVATDDIGWIQQTIKTHAIDTKITALIEHYTHQANEAIIRIPMTKEQRTLFSSFVEYLSNRIQ